MVILIGDLFTCERTFTGVKSSTCRGVVYPKDRKIFICWGVSYPSSLCNVAMCSTAGFVKAVKRSRRCDAKTEEVLQLVNGVWRSTSS